MKMKIKGGVTLAAVLTLAALMAGPAAAGPKTFKAYNSVPTTVPGNVASVGFEATGANELGDEVILASAPHLNVKQVRVVMSSWGCENGSWNTNDCSTTTGATFNEPITLNIYAGNGGPTPGALLVTQTRTFKIKYRPSENAAHCTGANLGKWWNSSNNTCYKGFAQSIKFAFPGTGIPLPTDVVWTVAYNTTHYGYSPRGEGQSCYTESGGCGYDSLNVGTEGFPSQPSVGTDLDPNGLYWNTAFASNYCDGGAGGVGTLRLDTNGTNDCWGSGVAGFPNGLTPLATITTK